MGYKTTAPEQLSQSTEKQKGGHKARPYGLLSVRRSKTAATTRLPIENQQSAITNELIPATTDSPTRFPLQYHGPWRA